MDTRDVNQRFLAYLQRRRWGNRFRAGSGIYVVALLVGVLVTVALYAAVKQVDDWWLMTPEIFILAMFAWAAAGLQRAWKAEHRTRKVVADGRFVQGALVQANYRLFQPGWQDLPCVVVFSFEEACNRDPAYLLALAEKVGALKGRSGTHFETIEAGSAVIGTPTDGKDTLDAELAVVARLLELELAVRYRRRRLPETLTGGPIAYVADLWITRAYLRNRYLTGRVLHCIAETGEEGGLELVPDWIIEGRDTP